MKALPGKNRLLSHWSSKQSAANANRLLPLRQLADRNDGGWGGGKGLNNGGGAAIV